MEGQAPGRRPVQASAPQREEVPEAGVRQQQPRLHPGRGRHLPEAGGGRREGALRRLRGGHDRGEDPEAAHPHGRREEDAQGMAQEARGTVGGGSGEEDDGGSTSALAQAPGQDHHLRQREPVRPTQEDRQGFEGEVLLRAAVSPVGKGDEREHQRAGEAVYPQIIRFRQLLGRGSQDNRRQTQQQAEKNT